MVLHRRNGRQNFGGAKYFCPNFPKRARNNLQRNGLLKNDCISFHVGRIFKSKHTSNTIFAQISPNLPEKE